MNTHAIIISRIFQIYSALFVLFLFALFSYLYFMFASIYETALRKDYNIKSMALKSAIAQKESEYLKQKEAVKISDALQNGYVKLQEENKSFAKRKVFPGFAKK